MLYGICSIMLTVKMVPYCSEHQLKIIGVSSTYLDHFLVAISEGLHDIVEKM